MDQPLVSVIIPNYNYANYLREAIDSVLAQTYPNIEIIVVDDGSKDASREVIESYGDKVKAIFQQNQGVAKARNNGVAISKGEYIAFLDADDVWLPEKAAEQAAKLKAEHAIGLVHAGVMHIDAEGNHSSEIRDGLGGDVSAELLRFSRPVILGGGSGIMLRRTAFDKVGGFDLRLSTSADWDLFYQVSSLFKVAFIDKVLLKYRLHGSNMHGNIRVMEHDMLLGFEKAFSGGARIDPGECYSNLYMTLAGSYFQAGNYSKFLEFSLKSLKRNPAKIAYLLSYPLRLISRASGNSRATHS